MNNQWFDEELADIDKEPESWPDALNNMFDGAVDVIDVEDSDEDTRQRFSIQRKT